MFAFRVFGWFMYKPRPPSPDDKFKSTDVTLIIPTIDCDEEAMHEAMRSWIMNEPAEIIIITVGMAVLPTQLECVNVLLFLFVP